MAKGRRWDGNWDSRTGAADCEEREEGGGKLVLLTRVDAKPAANLSQNHQKLNPSSSSAFD